MAKSREYNIGGSKVSYEFSKKDGKLIGITKDGVPVDPIREAATFDALANTGVARNAYNVNKFGGDKKSYVGIFGKAEQSSITEQVDNFNKNKKKSDNQQFVDNNPPPTAFATPRNTGSQYRRGKQTQGIANSGSEILAYPLDIDPTQDHIKITRYEYIRTDINASKPAGQTRFFGRKINIAGDSVKGSKPKGSILLPMPKPTDVNAADWGKSELNESGLFGLGAAAKLSLGGAAIGKDPVQRAKEGAMRLRKSGNMFRDRPGATGLLGIPGGVARSRQFLQAQAATRLAKTASAAAGVEIDTDTLLARVGSKVLNPNAEMLFQGPTIRQFAFSFQMIARSEKEGKEIRRIIKFLKEGMAPKFENTTFLKNPDIFILQYKNGKGEFDILRTVNQFNPGGLALTLLNTDYAPSGYWSAYTDSQPVAIKMDMNFTELRPMYQDDQLALEGDNVGY